MTCSHCVSAVREVLEAVQGVRSAEVSLEAGHAVVEVGADVEQAALVRAVEGAGYAVGEQAEVCELPGPDSSQSDARQAEGPVRDDLRFRIEGMTCASCVAKVERALGAVPGVAAARVNFGTERASLALKAGATTSEVERLAVHAVRRAGYLAISVTDDKAAGEASRERRAAEASGWKRRWMLGAALSAPIVFLEMGSHWLGRDLHFHGSDALAFVLATLVVAILGARFFMNAARGLRHLQFTMDSLVSLGVGAAYAYSAAVRIASWLGSEIGEGHVYFESAAVILTLVSLGKWLEAGARLRTGDAIRSLMELAPKKARVERDGREVEIPHADIVSGDLMIVRPGEKVPTDGTVVGGGSLVDEAMITGESMPVEKAEGASVFGSTINTSGLLRVRATRVGSETALARIIEMVERAQEGKASVQKLADSVSNVFVPGVMVVGLLTLVGWGWIGDDWAAGFSNAVTVLIIACPCALGLATPTALMVGTGRGAKEGVLIRDVSAIERAHDTDVVVLDKTGTVTEGKPAVTDVVPAAGHDEGWVLAMAASVEHGSEHPLAKAILAAAASRGIERLEMTGFKSVAGSGVSATVGGRRILVVSPKAAVDAGIALPPEQLLELARLEGEAKTVVAVADEDARGLLGWVGIADRVKDSSPEAIRALGAETGLQVWLLTGDNSRTASAVAASVGIHPGRVIAEVRPEEKARRVQELQGRGHRVAMIGDGINDAPALAQANLGIALGTGTDVAMEAGAITLVSGNLMGAVRAIRLSRATMRKIRQNLFWAFAYNVVLIPVAAMGMLSPIFAGAAMAISSVSVVGNSLLLGKRQGN